MSGIKGIFLLFMVLGAMYLGAKAEVEAEAKASVSLGKGESAELRGHAHFGNTNCFMCSLEPCAVYLGTYRCVVGHTLS